MRTPRYFSAKASLLGALFLIAVLFVGSSGYASYMLNERLTEQERLYQDKLSMVFSHALSEYFKKMHLVAEYASKSPAFEPERTSSIDTLRYLPFYGDTVGMSIDSILQYIDPNTSTPPKRKELPYVWQVFKGLPLVNANKDTFALERRRVAETTLKVFPGLHYVFELDAKGNMIFLHRFGEQKNISRFNYSFRDYYKEVTSRRSTVLSEGYISRDQNRTRIISVAAPIFDSLGVLRKIFAVSVSADTLRKQVFGPLIKGMNLDSTAIYLLDRHGHVVTGSRESVAYIPEPGRKDDERDPGNMRGNPLLRTLRWTTDILEPGNVDHRMTKSWPDRLMKIPVSAEYENLDSIHVQDTFLPLSILEDTITRWGLLIETPTSKILQPAKNAQRVFYVAGFFLALVLVALSIVLFKSFAKVEEDLQEVAERVSHNIRSPLAALDLLTQSFGQLPEERRILIRSAVNRIQDIANELVSNQRRGSENSTASSRLSRPAVLMSSLLSEIISEKRIHYRPRIGLTIESDIGPHSYGLFAAISPRQLRPVLSNIIDNSADAIDDKGTIRVSLAGEAEMVSVTVSDTGKGIPPAILGRLGTKHFSYGKTGGKGLGLYEARRVIESLGGRLHIESQVGVGTSLTVTIPRGVPPRWFVPEIRLCEGMLLAVVDDDQSIHQIWSDRLARSDVAGHGVEVRHFSSPSEFVDFMRVDRSYHHRLFLVDFEYLSDPRDGLSVIEELGIASDSILVTSHFDHKEVLRRANQLGVGVLPKSMAPYIPLRVQPEMSGTLSVSE